MRHPRSLRSRLILSHLVVVLVALGTVFLAISLVGPGYFAEAMGHRPGDPAGQAMDAATLGAFQDASWAALAAALAVALITAIAVALALSSHIANPVTRLAAATRRIADGHYAERVSSSRADEVGQLAANFNEMAGSLEAIERRRLELVGDVAHELRTPLTTLDGYLEGLQDDVISASPETWVILRRETARLSRLVADLQDLWRAEALQLPLEIEVFDASTVVRAAVEQAGPLAALQQISLVMEPSIIPTLVLADRDRVTQIVMNYLSNAIRYSPNGTTVTIAIRIGSEIVISVRDDGPGLTSEQQARIFERFYRIDPSRSRALGGTGIGLAIVRALAEAMNGRAWVESDGLGTGATFAFSLPAA